MSRFKAGDKVVCKKDKARSVAGPQWDLVGGKVYTVSKASPASVELEGADMGGYSDYRFELLAEPASESTSKPWLVMKKGGQIVSSHSTEAEATNGAVSLANSYAELHGKSGVYLVAHICHQVSVTVPEPYVTIGEYNGKI